jgi:hypothetical protein
VPKVKSEQGLQLGDRHELGLIQLSSIHPAAKTLPARTTGLNRQVSASHFLIAAGNLHVILHHERRESVMLKQRMGD